MQTLNSEPLSTQHHHSSHREAVSTMVKTRHSAKSAIPSEPPAHLPAMSPAPNSNFPPRARFPVLVFLSMGLSSFLYSIASPLISGDLAAASHTRDSWYEVSALLGWKAAQLAVGWYGGYDSMISLHASMKRAPYWRFCDQAPMSPH